MQHLLPIASLRAALLALAATTAGSVSATEPELPWPYNLPAHVKYFPEDEFHVKRGIDIEQRLATEVPIGVKKMSEDAGEKFLFDYWIFGPSGTDDENDGASATAASPAHLRQRAAIDTTDNQDSSLYANTSIPLSFSPPFLQHTDEKESPLLLRHPSLRYLPRKAQSLFQRGFQCPAGTSNCSSIGRPDSCCANGETCQLITDTGLGDVGCCPAGQTCSGQVSTCGAGYSSCPNFPGGGCCIPNYTCLGSGCAYVGTTTVVTTITNTIRTIATPTILSSAGSSSSSLFPSSSSSPSSASFSTTPSPSQPPLSQTPLTCSTGYKSCPATLGGGCCPSSRECGFAECPASSTSPASSSSAAASAGPPIRPTTVSTSASTSASPSPSSSPTISVCPTGFYMCSAYYLGGCCRVDRNCDTASCPPRSSTTDVNTHGVTVVAPASATTEPSSPSSEDKQSTSAVSSSSSSSRSTNTPTKPSSSSSPASVSKSQQGTCASGWFKCASTDGGGCCPSGYACGAACTATATISGKSGAFTTDGPVIGKMPSSGAARMSDSRTAWVERACGAIALLVFGLCVML
ncbi:hypothetical protein L228DRAFT_236648 [Xylona heveae TC161]|uniref:Carbohydrate-binding module family 18 protein n=1 Tax=Xylona heveae (strain CBS 132557 / TC161) TaxID=1328760 RepID=A0A161TH47_XYLHT|nr:hypothetical protein L228DRAFT_236648 [Xylona heveae TC161]KZF25567.1 hypothetical protein L228DRAFT_236648 [Xylona heveae TC161]